MLYLYLVYFCGVGRDLEFDQLLKDCRILTRSEHRVIENMEMLGLTCLFTAILRRIHEEKVIPQARATNSDFVSILLGESSPWDKTLDVP